MYTLDRLEKSIYVFLENGKEAKELLIPDNEIAVDLQEGDIVEIETDGTTYKVVRLEEKTEERKKSVTSLLEKLMNRS